MQHVELAQGVCWFDYPILEDKLVKEKSINAIGTKHTELKINYVYSGLDE